MQSSSQPTLPDRPFVAQRNDQGVPANVKFSYPVRPGHQPLVSIIIPTSDGSREGYLPVLLEQLSRQTFQDFEVIIIEGDKRQGRAINCGADLARGEILVTFDDDSRLADNRTLQLLVNALDSDPKIGAVGGANLVLDSAPWLVKRVMLEIPRRSSPPVDQIVDSDMAEHPCLAMRKSAFKEAGGENELIPRGLDPYLRQQFREKGYRVVVAPGVLYHHLPPSDLSTLVRQFFRNGAQSRYCSIHYPQWVFDTLDEHGDDRSPMTSLPGRIVRFGKDLLKHALQGHAVYVACHVSYALGWFYESLFGQRQQPAKR
jgi:hypothetical protein